MTTETKVEAVAWAMTDYQDGEANTQFTYRRDAAEHYASVGLQVEPLYPASAITALEGEVASLRAFAQDVMNAWPEGGIDGFELQEYAEKHGLLRKTVVAEPCGDNCGCAEYLTEDDYPADCYRKTPLLTKEQP